MSRAPLQQVAIVPTSNAPPTWEWSRPSWYVLNLDALQASPDLDDYSAELLVKGMEARKITLPCPECRGHYVTDWDTFPFTLEHARSPDAAMAWVQALKDRVDARVAAEKKAAGSGAAAAAVAAGATTLPRPAPVTATRNRFATRTPSVSLMRSVNAARMASRPNVTPALRAVAVRSALSETEANRKGIVRGCRNCAKK